MYLPFEHPIFDPKNDHLFTAEAASKAFSHVELSGQEDAEISKQREGRLANIVIWGIALSMLIAFATAVAANLFMKCPWHMNRLIFALLKDEERSRTMLAAGAAIAGVLAMALALAVRFL